MPTFAYSHDLGIRPPTPPPTSGADITISPRIIATTRFGYYFQNYHDFGYPTNAELTIWQTSSTGANDSFGAPLPTSLQQANGYFNAAQNQNIHSPQCQ